MASESPLFSGCEIVHIPYGVDREFYKPEDARKACGHIGLAPDKKVVMFMTSGDPRKGYEHFEKAMLKLADQSAEILILTMGRQKLSDTLKRSFVTRELGYLTDPAEVRMAYSAADVYVMPSLQDNLPNVVLESMACGTPAVCYDTGGVPDMIEHLENGYLAVHGDPGDLAKGIRLLLGDRALLEKMGDRSVSTISEKFTESLQAGRYIELYKRLLDEFKAKKARER